MGEWVADMVVLAFQISVAVGMYVYCKRDAFKCGLKSASKVAVGAALFFGFSVAAAAGTEINPYDEAREQTEEFSALSHSEQNWTRVRAGLTAGLVFLVPGLVGAMHGKEEGKAKQVEQMLREQRGEK